MDVLLKHRLKHHELQLFPIPKGSCIDIFSKIENDSHSVQPLDLRILKQCSPPQPASRELEKSKCYFNFVNAPVSSDTWSGERSHSYVNPICENKTNGEKNEVTNVFVNTEKQTGDCCMANGNRLLPHSIAVSGGKYNVLNNRNNSETDDRNVTLIKDAESVTPITDAKSVTSITDARSVTPITDAKSVNPITDERNVTSPTDDINQISCDETVISAEKLNSFMKNDECLKPLADYRSSIEIMQAEVKMLLEEYNKRHKMQRPGNMSSKPLENCSTQDKQISEAENKRFETCLILDDGYVNCNETNKYDGIEFTKNGINLKKMDAIEILENNPDMNKNKEKDVSVNENITEGIGLPNIKQEIVLEGIEFTENIENVDKGLKLSELNSKHNIEGKTSSVNSTRRTGILENDYQIITGTTADLKINYENINGTETFHNNNENINASVSNGKYGTEIEYTSEIDNGNIIETTSISENNYVNKMEKTEVTDSESNNSYITERSRVTENCQAKMYKDSEYDAPETSTYTNINEKFEVLADGGFEIGHLCKMMQNEKTNKTINNISSNDNTSKKEDVFMIRENNTCTSKKSKTENMSEKINTLNHLTPNDKYNSADDMEYNFQSNSEQHIRDFNIDSELIPHDMTASGNVISVSSKASEINRNTCLSGNTPVSISSSAETNGPNKDEKSMTHEISVPYTIGIRSSVTTCEEQLILDGESFQSDTEVPGSAVRVINKDTPTNKSILHIKSPNIHHPFTSVSNTLNVYSEPNAITQKTSLHTRSSDEMMLSQIKSRMNIQPNVEKRKRPNPLAYDKPLDFSMTNKQKRHLQHSINDRIKINLDKKENGGANLSSNTRVSHHGKKYNIHGRKSHSINRLIERKGFTSMHRPLTGAISTVNNHATLNNQDGSPIHHLGEFNNVDTSNQSNKMSDIVYTNIHQRFNAWSQGRIPGSSQFVTKQGGQLLVRTSCNELTPGRYCDINDSKTMNEGTRVNDRFSKTEDNMLANTPIINTRHYGGISVVDDKEYAKYHLNGALRVFRNENCLRRSLPLVRYQLKCVEQTEVRSQPTCLGHDVRSQQYGGKPNDQSKTSPPSLCQHDYGINKPLSCNNGIHFPGCEGTSSRTGSGNEIPSLVCVNDINNTDKISKIQTETNNQNTGLNLSYRHGQNRYYRPSPYIYGTGCGNNDIQSERQNDSVYRRNKEMSMHNTSSNLYQSLQNQFPTGGHCGEVSKGIDKNTIGGHNSNVCMYPNDFQLQNNISQIRSVSDVSQFKTGSHSITGINPNGITVTNTQKELHVPSSCNDTYVMKNLPVQNHRNVSTYGMDTKPIEKNNTTQENVHYDLNNYSRNVTNEIKMHSQNDNTGIFQSKEHHVQNRNYVNGNIDAVRASRFMLRYERVLPYPLNRQYSITRFNENPYTQPTLVKNNIIHENCSSCRSCKRLQEKLKTAKLNIV